MASRESESATTQTDHVLTATPSDTTKASALSPKSVTGPSTLTRTPRVKLTLPTTTEDRLTTEGMGEDAVTEDVTTEAVTTHWHQK